MIPVRHLAPIPNPADFSLTQLRQAAASRFPTLVDCNLVERDDGVLCLAIYLPEGNTTNPAAWQQSVASYVATHPTPEEQSAAGQANEQTIRQQAVAAIAANVAYKNITGPTNAQVVAQVRALTTNQNGLLRLLIGQLDATG